MKGVYIFLANGFEEIEALATLDVLRRGGVDVTTVSIHRDKFVTGAHKITVVADMTCGEFKANLVLGETDFDDVMIFPGGMHGTKNLAEDSDLMNLMKLHYAEGGSVAAICAAPGLVVTQLPDIEGLHCTCYDGFEGNLMEKGAEYVQAPAVVDGNLITGRGPGCAIDFGLAILAHLKGDELAAEVRAAMMI